MKLTRHNGRSGKNGVYSPKHNDRSFDIANSDHINAEKEKYNIYWDCYHGYRSFFLDVPTEQMELSETFEDVEKRYYADHYGAYVEGQNARNEKNRHTERNRTTDEILKNRKTAPEESIYQIGTMDEHIEPDVFAVIVREFIEEQNRRFGEHIHVLNWALHLDESTPHIHERHVFDCENKYGELFPQQEKALEKLGFELPEPDKKAGKFNNRKMVFDNVCRTILFDICKKHGLTLDEEPDYGGREYLEKQDYILKKQKEKLQVQEQSIAQKNTLLEKQDQAIEEKKEALEDLVIRIEDTESFIDEVSDVAYERAVEVVTDKAVEETHNMDFDVILKHRDAIVSSKSKSTPAVKSIASRVLDGLIKKFNGLTEHISEKLREVFKETETKEELKRPIKESIKDRLSKAKDEADAVNADRSRNRETTKARKLNKEL